MALLACAALEKGQLDKVTDELNTARSLGYPKSELERLHAVVLARIGRYAEAEPILVRFFEGIGGPDPLVDGALARVYLMTYRLQQAEEVIRRWIKDAPADGRPYLWLTEIDRRMEVDNLDTQVRHYREALDRDPSSTRRDLVLAETLRKMHTNVEAEREYARYLARHPDDAAGLPALDATPLSPATLTAGNGFLDRAYAVVPDDALVLKGRASLEMARGRARRRGLARPRASDRSIRY